MGTDQKYVFTVISITGKIVGLKQSTLVQHVLSEHNGSRDILLNEENLHRTASIIAEPEIIIEQPNGRKNYYGLTPLKGASITALHVVTENCHEGNLDEDIVTIIPTNHGKIKAKEGRHVLYDRHSPK